jgi:hypothetical protein
MHSLNQKPHVNKMKWAFDAMLPLISACPHIIKPEQGVEAFVEDLNKAAEKFALYFFDENKD